MKREEIKLLLQAIERAVDYKVCTTRGFERLSQMILQRTRENISVSTLKRIWGYVHGYDDVRTSTVDVLSKFVGYKDYEHFSSSIKSEADVIASDFFLGECIYVDDIYPGRCFRLTWAPDRVCDIRYEGDNRFVVTESAMTRLVAGTTFRCHVIEIGQPLYIYKVVFPSSPQHEYCYIACSNGGVQVDVKSHAENGRL